MAKIQTTGQLRNFLAQALVDLQAGALESEVARNITKMAAQINESFYAEIKIAKIQADLGQTTSGMGELPLGKNDN